MSRPTGCKKKENTAGVLIRSFDFHNAHTMVLALRLATRRDFAAPTIFLDYCFRDNAVTHPPVMAHEVVQGARRHKTNEKETPEAGV